MPGATFTFTLLDSPVVKARDSQEQGLWFEPLWSRDFFSLHLLGIVARANLPLYPGVNGYPEISGEGLRQIWFLLYWVILVCMNEYT